MIRVMAFSLVLMVAAQAYRVSVLYNSHAIWTWIEVNNEDRIGEGLVPNYERIVVTKENSFSAFHWFSSK